MKENIKSPELYIESSIQIEFCKETRYPLTDFIQKDVYPKLEDNGSFMNEVSRQNMQETLDVINELNHPGRRFGDFSKEITFNIHGKIEQVQELNGELKVSNLVQNLRQEIELYSKSHRHPEWFISTLKTLKSMAEKTKGWVAQANFYSYGFSVKNENDFVYILNSLKLKE